MKRFASIYPFLEAGPQPRHIGRLVANHDFVKALLTYGTFDEYVFSNTSVANLTFFADTVRGWRLPNDGQSRVRYITYAGLPAILREKAFHVMHLAGWGWFMPGAHYLRARYASNAWPITAVTHSLVGPDVIDYAVRLSHAGLASFDSIVCTSHDGREALRKILAGGQAIAGRPFAGRLDLLPLGIDDEWIDAPVADGSRERVRAELGLPEHAAVLLVLGRITPSLKMDLAPLVRTFAHDILPRSTRPIVLFIAGSGDPGSLAQLDQEIDRQGVRPHVKVWANFPDDRKRDLLAASDMLVSPVDNAQETFGLSLLEAMAAGLPVVASRFDGYKDIVSDQIDGFLIDTYGGGLDPLGDWFDVTDPAISQLLHAQTVAVDMAQLADRVLRLISDEELRRRMGQAGRAKVDAYRWSRVIARYEELWDHLAADAQIAGIPRASDNPYNLSPARVFSHYPSQALDAELRVTASGDPESVRPYDETAVLFGQADLTRLHARAAAAGSAGITVRELVAVDGTPNTAAVLWLLKYDFLRVLSKRHA